MAIVRNTHPGHAIDMTSTWLDFFDNPNGNTVLSRTPTQWVIQVPGSYTYVIKGANLSTAATALPTVGVIKNIYYYDAAGDLVGSTTNFSVNAQNFSRPSILSGNDTIHLTQHADNIYAGTGADIIVAEHGSDATGDFIFGGAGIDTLRFTTTVGDFLVLNSNLNSVEKIYITDSTGASTGTINANVYAADVTYGLEMRGNDGSNEITGTAFADQIDARAGFDVIDGGGGADTMTGGLGDDYFVISGFVENYTSGPADLITDFTIGQDKIDLSALEAIAGDPSSSFFFTSGVGLGTVSLEAGPNPGDVRVVIAPDANINDYMVINVHITNGTTLTASDFIL